MGDFDKGSIGQNEGAREPERNIETMAADHRDLSQTLPQATLRPTEISQVISETKALSVRPRQVQSVTEGASHDQLGGPSQSSGGLDYLKLQLLGEGGMGTVHLAKQVALGREVALKQIKSGQRGQKSVENDFFTEAVLTGRLEHPNIVPIYEVGSSSDGGLFYSMKNIKGEVWEDSIDALTLTQNLDILINVCDAVAFAHAEGVVHRDLKPQNIMTGGFGEVLVLDWGLAVLTGPDGTVQASLAGTPAYLAPEMVNPPLTIGPFSDIYLLGGMLLRILTGKAPHRGKSAIECLAAASKNEIVCGDPDRLHRIDPSGELMEVALQAMATHPQDRFPTVQEFQRGIRDFLSHRESLDLSGRAQASLEAAQPANDYSHFSRAVFGFEEALRLWDANVFAAQGVTAARKAWAICAEAQSDFDLALSLLDDSIAEQLEIRVRVTAARYQRDRHRHHVRRLRRISLVASLAIAVVSCAAAVWINTERSKAETARIVAVSEKAKAESAQARAEMSRESAERQLYVNQIQSAQREWDVDNSRAARLQLGATQIERRNWEYNYLWKLFNRHEGSFQNFGVVLGLTFSPDGAQVISSSRTWDKTTGRAVSTREYGAGAGVSAASFSPDGRGIVTGVVKEREIPGAQGRVPPSGELTLRDTVAGAEIVTVKLAYPALALQFSPDGSRIVSGGGYYNSQLLVHDARSGAEILNLEGHSLAVNAVAYSADGNRIVSGSDDNSLRVWDAGTGQTLTTLNGHTGAVNAVAFSPDGGRILSGSDDTTLRLWDAGTGRLISTLKGHMGAVTAAAFSPDGKRIVSGSGGNGIGEIKLWDTSTGHTAVTLKGHTGHVNAVAFSPDGDQVVSGSVDQSIKLWNTRLGISL